MHLAILMTNTDESVFSQAWPKDGEKFSALVQELRPDWSTEVFSVKDGIFPQDIGRFDGVMITGSPASVQDEAPWVVRLFELIREIANKQLPLFGACFGHQAIAVALGGAVGRNPEGWVHGLAEVVATRDLPWTAQPEKIGLYASHIEQVTVLPEGCEIVAQGPGCPVSGFIKGGHIFTTQYHPEMSDEFIAALVEECLDYVGEQVTEVARASLTRRADRDVFARQIVSFFEWASDAH